MNFKRFDSLLLLIFALFFSLSCSTTRQAPDKSGQASPAAKDSSSLSLERPVPYPVDLPMVFEYALENGTRSEEGEPGEEYWQNYASYDLRAELDPEHHTLHGSADVVYYNHSPDELNVIVVELAQNLHKEGTPKKEMTEITGGKQLTSIAVNGREIGETSPSARWSQQESGYILEGTQLYIFPEENLSPGDSLNLAFEWSFVIPERGASGRMGRSRDNLYYLAYWYPHIAVYDDVNGWFTDPFLGNAEFYHGFADYELSVTAPPEWIVMGTGEFLNPEETLSGQTLERYIRAGESDDVIIIADFDELGNATQKNDKGTLTWKFRAEQVRDVAFSATLESRWDGARTPVGDLDGDGETDYSRINSFFRETAPLWEEQADYARHSISFLSEYTGFPYPWPHMTSVEGADIIGGGMEFPMMTIIGDYNTAGAVRLYGVTAHELAHMWFPMIVSTNERRYTWIDEGYTTFHTNEANIDYWGEDRFDRFDVFGGYLQIAGTDLEGEMMRWSDYHYPGPAYSVASYPKPASVLYALKGVLGDDLFMKAHRQFIRTWAYKHPYPWDIFHTFEAFSGEDLSWFWRSWYYETWVLHQKLADVYEDGDETVIVIEDSGNVPMPVLLRVTLDDGSVIEKRTGVEHWLNGHRTLEVRLTTDQPVIKVEIDPEEKFPHSDFGNHLWERNSSPEK